MKLVVDTFEIVFPVSSRFITQISLKPFWVKGKLDDPVKSHISPPLVGGDKGEGDVSD